MSVRAGTPAASDRSEGRHPSRSLLRSQDVLRLGTTGLRARPLRAVLSALGIAIGIAAMVAVVGISSSSRAQLDAQLARLGTNLLTVQAGKNLLGETTSLPENAVAKIGVIDGVEQVSSSADLAELSVYRSRLIDPAQTGGIGVRAVDLGLPSAVGAEIRSGTWLNEATAGYPSVVLGSDAARRLGIVTPGSQIWLGGMGFTVIGILEPVALAPELDASALVGLDIAASRLGFDGKPTTVYQRSADAAVEEVRQLIPRTVNPESPDQVEISRPSDALAAKNAADQAFTGLLLGLGSVALLVGGIGVANTMVISVLERRREIGLRRALGATRGHIRSQFLVEALILSAIGGLAGAGLGAGVTTVIATMSGWPTTIPLTTLAMGVGATLAIGAVAGLYPAIRAARTPPTTALSG